MEYLFLDHTFRWLVEDGVLLMVVPQERLDSAIPLLAGNFTDLRIFRLTDPEAERFDQVVLFGVRKRIRGEHYDRNRALLIGLTGTLMGGYADDLFNLFYRMEPRRMVADGFAAGTTGRRDFATRYGVMESIEKIPDEDNACTRTAKSDVRLVRKPGASPLVFGKFLMASTAFVTLDDIADYLPPYEESVIEVEMDETLGRAYEHVEKDIREAVAANRGNRSLMSLMMHRLLALPGSPVRYREDLGEALQRADEAL